MYVAHRCVTQHSCSSDVVLQLLCISSAIKALLKADAQESATFRHSNFTNLSKPQTPNQKHRHPKTQTQTSKPQTLRNNRVVAKIRVSKCLHTDAQYLTQYSWLPILDAMDLAYELGIDKKLTLTYMGKHHCHVSGFFKQFSSAHA